MNHPQTYRSSFSATTTTLRAALAISAALATMLWSRSVHAACLPDTSFELVSPPPTVTFMAGTPKSQPVTIKVKRVARRGFRACAIVARSLMGGVKVSSIGGVPDVAMVVAVPDGAAEQDVTFEVHVSLTALAGDGVIEMRLPLSGGPNDSGLKFGEVPVHIEPAMATVTYTFRNLEVDPTDPPSDLDVIPDGSDAGSDPDGGPFTLPPVAIGKSVPLMAPKELILDLGPPRRYCAFEFWTYGQKVDTRPAFDLSPLEDTVAVAWYRSCGIDGDGDPTDLRRYLTVRTINLATSRQVPMVPMDKVLTAPPTSASTCPALGSCIVPSPFTLCLSDECIRTQPKNVEGSVTAPLSLGSLVFDSWRIRGVVSLDPKLALNEGLDIAFYKAAPPAAPSAFVCKATRVGLDWDVKLDWVDNSSDETEFHIERKFSGDDWAPLIAKPPAGTMTFTDAHVPSNKYVSYRISAHRHPPPDSTFSVVSNIATCRTFTCDPLTCPGLDRRVPGAVINGALADPSLVGGFCFALNPSMPFHPLYNPYRTRLTLHNARLPFHPLYNSLAFKSGCY